MQLFYFIFSSFLLPQPSRGVGRSDGLRVGDSVTPFVHADAARVALNDLVVDLRSLLQAHRADQNARRRGDGKTGGGGGQSAGGGGELSVDEDF